MTEKKTPFTPRFGVTVLGPDEPKKETLGWKFVELPIGMTWREYYKKEFSEEDFKKWEYENSSVRNKETDKADEYRIGHTFEDKKSWSGGTIPVLQILWGQPWNNLAMNYIHALRPSSLRVATDGITLDSQAWRVTVWLEEDGRTIRNIDQEVDLATRGAIDGHDLSLQLKYQIKHGSLDGYEYQQSNGICFLNDKAAITLEVDDKDE
jgi:hypothetical protein